MTAWTCVHGIPVGIDCPVCVPVQPKMPVKVVPPMSTPFPAAIQGLVEALRLAKWKGECGSCGEAIEVCDITDQPPDPEFPGCPGPAQRAALAAWESRGRLRDDEELVDACYKADPCADDVDAILAVVEAALLGERGP